MAKKNWKYIGCSDHNVPSLSKVAMRSGIGTKSCELWSVTFVTNATIACFAGPSFQEGSGSAPAAAAANVTATRRKAKSGNQRARLSGAFIDPTFRMPCYHANGCMFTRVEKLYFGAMPPGVGCEQRSVAATHMPACPGEPTICTKVRVARRERI